MLDETKPYKILSIDGGGIRGLIPALMLVEIEKRTGKAISELFDLIAGTSTGGILALGLNVPDAKTGKAAYSAEDIVTLYQKRGQNIFLQNTWRKFMTGLGIFDEKYSSLGIEQILEHYFGDVELKSAVTDVLITSYDFEKTRGPFFFKSWLAKTDPQWNFKMKFIARATSAAPTYFEPLKLNSEIAKDIYHSLVDGGIFANNPAMCAFADAVKYQQPYDMLMVSLGTGARTEKITHERAIHWGLVQWIRPLINLMMNGNSNTVDYQLREIFSTKEGSNYYRLQVPLPDDPYVQKLDNISVKNIEKLQQLTHELIVEKDQTIDEICGKLV